MKRTIEDYIDIIHMPHHISEKHPPMSVYDRAAQFAPFAALTGHAAAVGETARLVDVKAELGEDAMAYIGHTLNWLRQHISEKPVAEITFFIPDKSKDGGRYKTSTGIVIKIDSIAREIMLDNGARINLDDIYSIEIK